MITWTSFRMSLGNRGRSGRSVKRECEIAFLWAGPHVGKNCRGSCPPAYSFLQIARLGKKFLPSCGLVLMGAEAGLKHSPKADGSICSAGFPAKLPVRS